MIFSIKIVTFSIEIMSFSIEISVFSIETMTFSIEIMVFSIETMTFSIEIMIFSIEKRASFSLCAASFGIFGPFIHTGNSPQPKVFHMCKRFNPKLLEWV